LHQHHGVDEDHRPAGGLGDADRDQAAQTGRQGEQSNPAGEPLDEGLLNRLGQHRQGGANDEQGRDHEPQGGAGEQVVVAHEGQQDGREHRAGHALQVGREARERQGLGVFGLVREQVRDHRLERWGEGGGCDIEHRHQGVDLPGLAHERQGSRDAGADDVQRDQQRLAGQPGRQRARERRDADIGDHLDGEGHAEHLAGIGPGQIMGQQTQSHRRHAGAEQGGDLGDEQMPVTGVTEWREHRGVSSAGVIQARLVISPPGG